MTEKILCAKETVLEEELNNINLELISIGQALEELGKFLIKNPAQVMIKDCGCNTPERDCKLILDFDNFKKYPEIIKELLRTYHRLKEELEKVQKQAKNIC